MRLGVAAAALFFTAIACGAQQETDVRAKVQAEVNAARQASRRAAAVFLDRSQSTEARLAAVSGQAAFVDRGDAVAALELVIDPEQPTPIRVRALQLGAHEIEQDQQLVSELMALLVSPATPQELRRAIVEVGEVLLISGTGNANGEDITAVMRQMTSDRDPQIRGMALGMLAAQGDDVAQKMLADDLRNPNVELVPPATAVSMLALHPDGDTLPVLREVAANPPSTEAQIEAIAALGADPQSHPQLQALIANNDAADEVRQAAAGALHANAPDLFLAPATKVVQDDGAGDELRIFVIKAVQQLREGRGSLKAVNAAERTFDQAVKRLARTKSAELRAAVNEYLSKTK